MLIAVAILWVWRDEPTLAGRYERSWKIARRLFRAVPKIGYQALIKPLGRHTTAVLDWIKPLLRRRLQRSLAAHLEVAGFGVDGSRGALPRTESNEARFSPLPRAASGGSRKPVKRWKKSRSRSRSANSRIDGS